MMLKQNVVAVVKARLQGGKKNCSLLLQKKTKQKTDIKITKRSLKLHFKMQGFHLTLFQRQKKKSPHRFIACICIHMCSFMGYFLL